MQKVIFLVLSIAIWYSSGQPEECIINSKYYIPNFTVNWHKAVEHCHYLGMRLATIPNEAVQSEVVEAIKASDKFNDASNSIWIGANDLAQESIFHWHATGQRVQYTNWQTGNPNNLSNKEHCVEMRYIPVHKSNWTWNDLDCTATNYFICEKMDAHMFSDDDSSVEKKDADIFSGDDSIVEEMDYLDKLFEEVFSNKDHIVPRK